MTDEATFNRLSISIRDFEKAIAFAEEAQCTPLANLAHEALMFSAIICYYRPFSPNERVANVKAKSQLKLEEFRGLTDDEIALHEKCKDLRNQALAHSEYKHNPTRLDESVDVIASRPFSLLSQSPDMRALSDLARKLADQCHHRRADYVCSRRALTTPKS